MKSTVLGGFIIVAGAIMFSAGATDGTGNSWMNWTISLQTLGGIALLAGLALGVKGVCSKGKAE